MDDKALACSTSSAPRWNRGGGGGGQAAGAPLPEDVRREILELGFPDDGYNYLIHLREIKNAGGGSAFYHNPKFRVEHIPRDVKVQFLFVFYSIIIIIILFKVFFFFFFFFFFNFELLCCEKLKSQKLVLLLLLLLFYFIHRIECRAR